MTISKQLSNLNTLIVSYAGSLEDRKNNQMKATDYNYTDRKINADSPLAVDFIEVVWQMDWHVDLSYLEQFEPDSEEGMADRERLEQFHNGNWFMMGCYAIAHVSYPVGQDSRRLETFRSGGLWGIESDSSKDYLNETEKEQLEDLKGHLEQFGLNVDLETVEIRKRK